MKIASKIFVTALLLGCTLHLQAQKYSSEKSLVSFFSDATLEDITAQNVKSLGIIDVTTNAIAFSIPISEFKFAKKLMQEHFNEKYMETEKYPKSTFEGNVIGFDQKLKGSQNVKAVGKLSIHGVTKEVELPGTIEVSGNKILITSIFTVKLEDYKIKIPQLMWQNIAEQVEVKVNFTLSQK